jgi:two-component system, NarL family, nitrate/nitrite response regulator NarL
MRGPGSAGSWWRHGNCRDAGMRGDAVGPGLQPAWIGRCGPVTSLVLGDDHVVFLDALSTALTQYGYITRAVAASRAEMVASVCREQPDACLIDRMPSTDDDAAETIGSVLAVSPGTAVLVLGADRGAQAVSRALDAGACGYVHQSRGLEAVVSALARIQHGGTVVDVPAAPVRSVQAETSRRLAAQLTSRERECLLMLIEGLDTTAMVERLGVSKTTVRSHLQSVLTKLGVHSRLEAVSFAVRHRLPDIWSEDVRTAAPCEVRKIRSPRRPAYADHPARQLPAAAQAAAR